MLKIIDYEGPAYLARVKGVKHRVVRFDYIRFEWENGYLDIRADTWEKLPQKKKNSIMKLG